jgi:hypothetical protein
MFVRELELAKDGKGNSLFSEVEDRRQKVEWQLRVANERYRYRYHLQLKIPYESFY